MAVMRKLCLLGGSERGGAGTIVFFKAEECAGITNKKLVTGELLCGEFCLSVFISMVMKFCI